MDEDPIRTELTAIADLYDTLPERRHKAVEQARSAGLTWREIAGLLRMTEHGVIKAQRSGGDR